MKMLLKRIVNLNYKIHVNVYKFFTDTLLATNFLKKSNPVLVKIL